MRSPLAWLLPGLAVAFGVGIAIGDRLAAAPLVGSLACGAAGAAALALRRRPHACALLACLCALGLGIRSIGLRLATADADRPRARLDAAVDARVCAQRRSPTWSIVELCGMRAVPLGARPATAPVPRRALLIEGRGTPEGAWLSQLVVAQRLRAWLRFDAIGAASNPGERDRQRPAARGGLAARARLLDARVAARVVSGPGTPSGSWNAARARTARRLGASGPGGGLLAALALGDRRALAEPDREAFRRLGIAHLLAVSGLHLALVGSLAFWAARRLLVRWPALAARTDVRVWAAAAAVGLGLGYALLTGWGAPVRRAWWFLLAGLGACLSRRAGTSLHALAAAFLAIAVGTPEAVFELGAQLSFVATAALLAAARPRGRRPGPGRLGRSVAWLGSGVRVSATAIAATAPVLAAHGLESTPVGLAGNLLAVPLTGLLLLPAALVAAGAAAASPGPGTDAVLAVCEGLASGVLSAARAAAAGLPAVDPGSPPARLAWLGAVVLAVACVAVRSTLARVLLCAAVCGWLALAPRARVGPPPPRIVVFDVGQGDAILVQGRGASLLVDAGAAWGDVDQGRRLVLPGLRALGLERLDVVIASHADADHRGGLPAILDGLEVGEVWIPAGGDAAFAALRRTARRRGVPLRELAAGDRPWQRADLALEVLWPERGAGAAPASGSLRNHRSLVVRAQLAGSRLLLTGDIGVDAEAALLEAPERLRADFLKVAHHGSRSASSRAFLDAVGFQVALLSAPCRPDGRLPALASLARLQAAGGSLWWTGRDGALVVALGGAPAQGAQTRDRVAGPTRVWGWRIGPAADANCGIVPAATPTNVDGRGVP